MRIAQLAPLAESVPPRLYGGSERVIATICDELVARGHAVTLFASGDSHTRAELVAVVPEALRLANIPNTLPAELRAISLAMTRAAEFDVIHAHLDLLAAPFARFIATPVVQTLHGRLELPELQPFFEYFSDVGLVSISDNQRRLQPQWNWLGTVYNGIALDTYAFHPERGRYLAFLGRICPEKGIEEAIQVSRITGLPLKIAAKVDPRDREYYETQIQPLFAESAIEYVGEIIEREKSAFLGEALALIFPIDWPEPFGPVMVEAMATGTPVLAGRYGSVSEVLRDGVTGFICDSVQELALACRQLSEINRARARITTSTTIQATAVSGQPVHREFTSSLRRGIRARSPRAAARSRSAARSSLIHGYTRSRPSSAST